MKRKIVLVAMGLFMFIACKKDSKKDCEMNNYGTVTINFAIPGNTYWVRVNGRLKINSSAASDTFHCGPGSASVEILNNTTTFSTIESVNVQTCKETVVYTSV